MLNRAGIDAAPNSAAKLAQEMLSGDLRVADMSRPVSAYSQQSRDLDKFNQLVDEVKTRIQTELQEVKKLPQEEQEAKVNRLERLKATVTKVRKVEDFYAFVSTAAHAMDTARAEYQRIMDLPEGERAKPENMNAMYEIKKTLDSFDTIKSIRNLLKIKEKKGKVLQQDRPRFDTIQERTAAIIGCIFRRAVHGRYNSYNGRCIITFPQ